MEVSPERIQRKIRQAGDLGAVVKTMKAIASSRINEYQKATRALDEYFQTLLQSMHVYLRHQPAQKLLADPLSGSADRRSQSMSTNVIYLVFGSDQGLVGPFNNTVSDFFIQSQPAGVTQHRLWAVGERVSFVLQDAGFRVDRTFPVPQAIENITAFISELLGEIDRLNETEDINAIYSFFNRPRKVEGYVAVRRQILPFEKEWQARAKHLQWPSNRLPQLIGSAPTVFSALIREYLFTSFYRAYAFSLSSENTSRLNAMLRAEKNIEELSEQLNSDYHRIRQNAIDTELFDVTAGFNFLKK